MIRQINGISYQLTRKNVKNINLRVKSDGYTYVSANKRVSLHNIDEFVASKTQWIQRAKERMLKRTLCASNVKITFTDDQCLKAFREICSRIFPLFNGKIGSVEPVIKVRNMTSCWGVCHYKKGYITLNNELMTKEMPAIEYVIAHELAHFIEPNHQANFHNIMKEIMPDYKERKKMLSNFN